MANEQLVLARATPIETVKDLLELQMRREVEEMAVKAKCEIIFKKGVYILVWGLETIYCETLPELHTKLKELTDET